LADFVAKLSWREGNLPWASDSRYRSVRLGSEPPQHL